MFIEERLDLGINYGTTATITTSTAIVETFSGIETRSINWVYPLLKFNIGQKSCLNEQLAYFLAFHAARKGAYEGFRFKDWSDYTFNTVITLNANKQAQLFKQYSVAGSSVKRPLSKIVTGTVLVFVNDVVTQGWTLNYNTGVITFNAIPTGTIRVSGEFDVPVRFESDKINLRFKAYEPGTERKLFDWEGLALTEVKISPAIPLAFDLIPQTLNHRINLGYDYDSIGGNEFATRIERLISGHETRISEWATNRGSWEVGSRTLLKSELDYLIALFRVCRGKAVSFKYFNWQSEEEIIVRFGEDAIAFRFDAYEKGTGRVLFNLAGVPLARLFNNATFVHLENFAFFSPEPTNINVVWNFAFTSTNSKVPSNAQIFLVQGVWDTQGQIGNFLTPDIEPTTELVQSFQQYSYNWTGELLPTALVETGPEIFIGLGNKIFGWVIEKDFFDMNPFSGASCQVQLKFVW